MSLVPDGSGAIPGERRGVPGRRRRRARRPVPGPPDGPHPHQLRG
nr:MAG TPA: hypothetical protein [Caudoviricetes sp.]DAS73360.1 MAG TPA: hypothetical protein [Caudoviricetes sp.]